MGLFKNLARQALAHGEVTGSDFPHCFLNYVDETTLVIYGVKMKEDYTFGKADIKSCTIASSGTLISFKGKMVIGTKYQVEFNDGKTALISVPEASNKSVAHMLM